MPFEFLEDIATADIAFKAWGENLSEAFIGAAEATMNVMIEDLETIRPEEKREILLHNELLDMLLFDLLQEIIYFKDAENLLLRIKEIEVDQKDGHYSMRAAAQGEKLDPHRHPTRVDVKAVTLHRFRLEKSPEGWETTVILDI